MRQNRTEIGLAKYAFRKLSKVLRGNILLETKQRALNCYAISIFLYDSEY